MSVHERIMTNPKKLQLTIVSARNLIAADSNGKSDPYAILKIGSHWKTKTKTIKKCLNPQWNQTFMIDLREPEKLTLEIEVMDEDFIGKDDALGVASYPLKDLPKGQEVTEWIGLRGVPCGEVQFVFKAIDFGKEDSAQAPVPQPQSELQSRGEATSQAPSPAQQVQVQEVTPSMYPDLQGIALQTSVPLQSVQQPSSTAQPAPSGGLTGQTVIAMYPFKAKGATFSTGDKDIDLNAHDVMTVLQDFGNGWIKVNLRGTIGLAPASYVKPYTAPVAVQTPVVVQTPPPQAQPVHTPSTPQVVESVQTEQPTNGYSQTSVPPTYQEPSPSTPPTQYPQSTPQTSTYPSQTQSYPQQAYSPPDAQPARTTYPPPVQNTYLPQPSSQYPVPPGQVYGQQPYPPTPSGPSVWGQPQGYPPQQQTYPPQQGQTYPYPNQQYPPQQGYPAQRWY